MLPTIFCLSTGLTQGILNVYYHTYATADGTRNVKRFKSRVEVATHLGLFPQVHDCTVIGTYRCSLLSGRPFPSVLLLSNSLYFLT